MVVLSFALLLLAWTQPAPPLTGKAAAIAAEIRDAGPDPDACFRVRDLEIQKEDIRLYLTDGYLAFGKPVAGRRLSAVFFTSESTDDAEVLLRPPDRGERASLAARSGSPNLNEHFRSAIFLFSDGSGEAILKQIREAPLVKPDPDMGLVIGDRWSNTLRNLSSSFLVRLVLDVLSETGPETGFFYGAIAGNTIGGFDVLHDPQLRERILVGALTSNTETPVFEVWASFPSRSQRQKPVNLPDPLRLENYRIDARLTPDLKLSVVTRATLHVLENLHGAIAFHIASQMEVTATTFDGVPMEVFRRDSMRDNLIRGSNNEAFVVALPRELSKGQTVEVEFRHEGRVVRSAGNDVFYVGARSNWYPTWGSTFSLFDLKFQVPKDLNIVATGELVEERTDAEWRYSHRRTASPVRIAGFNLGSYLKASMSRGGFQVEVFGNRRAEPGLHNRALPPLTAPPLPGRPPGRRPPDIVPMPVQIPPDPTARLNALAGDIAGALEWMASVFGPPPLRHLTVSPIPGNFGQGFPGLIYLSTMSFLPTDYRPSALRTGEQLQFYGDLLSAHETAHQWWGNLVTSASYHDEWLQEALASYSSIMFLEKRKGPRALEDALENSRNLLFRSYEDRKTVESAGPIVWGARLGNAGFGEPWRSITYEKGAWIIHMLRRRMGDTAFHAMLRALVDRYRYLPVSTVDFQKLVAEFSPKNLPDPTLENFFDNWVYSTGVPTLDLGCSNRGKAPAVTVNCTLRQSGVSDDFTVDVPVEIRLPGTAKPLVRWLRTSDEPATFSQVLKTPPLKVELGAVLQRSGSVR